MTESEKRTYVRLAGFDGLLQRFLDELNSREIALSENWIRSKGNLNLVTNNYSPISIRIVHRDHLEKPKYNCDSCYGLLAVGFRANLNNANVDSEVKDILLCMYNNFIDFPLVGEGKEKTGEWVYRKFQTVEDIDSLFFNIHRERQVA